MSVLQDLRKFVRQHRGCGVLTIHLEPPADTSYSIEIGCRACDAALCRTVDPASAAWDLMHTDLLLAAN
jgi:Fe-S-cluster-containing dehydrogenase component